MDGIKCFSCGKEGHIKKECPEIKAKKLAKIKCFNCGRHGHIAKECKEECSAPSGNLATTSSMAMSTSFSTVNGLYSCFNANEVHVPESAVKYIDSHCHLNYVFDKNRHREGFDSFKHKFNFPENFSGCITSFCDPASFSCLGICDDLLAHDQVWAAFGFHPHNAKYYNDHLEYKLCERLQHPKAVALGEIGLDYSVRIQSEVEVQKAVFLRQVRLAEVWKKPLVIHCREAENDVFDILSSNLPNNWKIHLHCYTGSYEIASKFLNYFPNLYLGISGVVTFPKASQVHSVVYNAPIERMILETDAPYLVPSCFGRDTRLSHPGMIPFIAKEVANIKNMHLDQVLKHALANTKGVYDL
ncbi:putative deoxyribonuclease TATDN2 [Dendronephthya gigantea]|uniref:putative deoxyribonuclease TATDN2 n=1 Tax=Dendronephthya gigantea TaxID=151771 RepID=UPI00106A58CF|nr:putative deoxyribonuclease TATDN2 [Dendronephthya gigantea]